MTSAAGRLFDAAAALVIGHHDASFEAEGPMRLEALCRLRREPMPLPVERDAAGIWRSDWSPLIGMLTDRDVPARDRAEVFHASMAGILRDQARRVREQRPVRRVGLCGGVFQNRVLTERAVALLEADGFQVFLPERLPANDAAISFGQAVEACARETGQASR